MQLEDAAAWITWGLTLISHVRYNFGRRSPWDSGHQDDVAYTPFTAAFWAIWVFWIILELYQLLFLTNHLQNASKEIKGHFIINNALLLSWSYLFSRSHYFLSEIVIILAFANAATAYLVTKSYAIPRLRSWIGVHIPVVALPMAWANYVILWNGAVLFHARNWPSRIIANLLVWELLVVPAFFLIVTGDYATSAAFAWLSLALGLGQLTTKIFALQWIFALVIAGVLLLLSFVYSLNPPQQEAAPLLGGHSEPTQPAQPAPRTP